MKMKRRKKIIEKKKKRKKTTPAKQIIVMLLFEKTEENFFKSGSGVVIGACDPLFQESHMASLVKLQKGKKKILLFLLSLIKVPYSFLSLSFFFVLHGLISFFFFHSSCW